MREGRWTTVTESEFDHERRGLEAIRERLPDADPWRAWSNFTFTAHTGHVREVDLLVVSPGGVWMIELKHWHGALTVENGTWVQTTPAGRRRPHGNPLHLVNRKAKELAGLLGSHGKRVWVGEAVCMTSDGLRLTLPPHERHGVHTIAGLVAMLKEPPREERRRITVTDSREIKGALDRVGIRRGELEYHVGPYRLERRPFDSGRTWADYTGTHTELPETARVRVYLSERGADATIRRSVENAARREAAVLRRFRHPGVVQLKEYLPSGHSAGPALIFEHHPGTVRLDEYLLRYGGNLDILGRMALVRQLAETMRSAHSVRLHHRALAARSIHVIPRERDPSGRAIGEEESWLTPHLRISDWQVATQRASESHDGAGPTGSRLAPTALSTGHVAEDSDPYLAPELTAPRADPVYTDVYGLGVLTYLLVTGRPPAASQAELLARLEAGEGLRPSSLVDDLSEDIDELVQAATAYRPERRLASVDEFLEMLEIVEEGLTAPPGDEDPPVAGPGVPEPEKDPLEAVAGDVLGGRWEVRRRLGTGSTSRAFLVRDLGAEARRTRPLAVLKVALSEGRGEVLVREAEVMNRLRADSRVIRLVEPDPLRVKGRTVLALEYVGDERLSPESAGEGAEGGSRRPSRREETVARQLRDSGRLPMDQLEAYGEYLFGAVDFLEGEGVWHRDIKPDNIAIRIRPNRTRQLVLIDFSLAGYPASEHDAGTEGYLDPFIGTLTRTAYDSHAERYAVAVTLHEMASRELPRWGDGSVPPRMTDPAEFPHPTIAKDAFEPAVRDGLVAFFEKALHRDAARRFPELKPMRDAWRKIFLDASRTVPSGPRSRPSSHRPEPVEGPTGEGPATPAPSGEPVIAEAEPLSAEQQRDLLAAEVSRETHLSAAGLSPAAESFLYGLGLTTVGDLLDHSRSKLLNAPGLGAKTRGEVQRRQRQWGLMLREEPLSPLTPRGRAEAREEIDRLTGAESSLLGTLAAGEDAGGIDESTLRSVSLDALATILVPEVNNNRSNRKKAEMARLLLRLPDEHGRLPDIGVWPVQKDVEKALGPTEVSVSLMLKEERKRWARHRAVRALREEIIGLLEGLGRVASAVEIADALAVRRGTQLPGREQRRALALAAVRAVVETEQLRPDEAEFLHEPNLRATEDGPAAGLLALDVRERDAPNTPSAPGLLDYAARLGRVADNLARLETLPTATTVLAELSALPTPAGTIEWDERRLVELAAAASTHAAATPRLEIYPRDLPLVRALRLTQAGLVRLSPGTPERLQPGLTEKEVHERVRSRFPELVVPDGRGSTTRKLPTGGPLTKALREAGFDLVVATRETDHRSRYLPANMDAASSYVSGGTRRGTTAPGTLTRWSDDPLVAGAIRAEERLSASARRDGYRVLTVHHDRVVEAIAELTTERIGARPVSVTRLLLDALRGLVRPGTKPTWETLLRADVAEPGSRGALKFSEYTRTAWGVVEPRVRGLLDPDAGPGPVLLTETAAFARYGAMDVLDRLADAARGGGRGLWLLVPQPDPAREPRLGAVAVAHQAGLGEWIELPDSWVRNAHRSDVGNTTEGDGT
ncbi:BREX system serine/threonine kinase PglW [Streptomyces sp. ST2-7A]|uniref:BREX system serine/threonine kinase PglW n=1 Tax=Streptomyces sp. ST2-7A TaxID=2907214 RepID=UPI001F398257|nr:BREX system serine/threonine kinase PglW [Streptomyces sp. ST2-7A]MCE7080365.1 BREX system serine/threonine kinase PglW [Streptomyces sp. ST2-7A]